MAQVPNTLDYIFVLHGGTVPANFLRLDSVGLAKGTAGRAHSALYFLSTPEKTCSVRVLPGTRYLTARNLKQPLSLFVKPNHAVGVQRHRAARPDA